MTQEKKKRLGSSQEIKFQCPEETKRRVKKEVNQVDRTNKDCDFEGCQQCMMSMIEDNSATARSASSVQAWMESSIHGEDKKSRNMINVHLDHEKSTIEHRTSNVPCPVENVAHAQPSVSHE